MRRQLELLLLGHFDLLKFPEGFVESLLGFAELPLKFNRRTFHVCTPLHKHLGKPGISHMGWIRFACALLKAPDLLFQFSTRPFKFTDHAPDLHDIAA